MDLDLLDYLERTPSYYRIDVIEVEHDDIKDMVFVRVCHYSPSCAQDLNVSSHRNAF